MSKRNTHIVEARAEKVNWVKEITVLLFNRICEFSKTFTNLRWILVIFSDRPDKEAANIVLVLNCFCCVLNEGSIFSYITFVLYLIMVYVVSSLIDGFSLTSIIQRHSVPLQSQMCTIRGDGIGGFWEGGKTGWMGELDETKT